MPGSSESGPPSPPGIAVPASYAVTITGTVSGRGFRREATLRIVPTIASTGTTNAVNPFDVCLVSGFPGGQPEVGAIWFSSNSGCNPGASAADLDLADISVDGSVVTVTPDSRIAATLGNNFTSSSSYISACVYAPVGGALVINIAEGSISGSLHVQGYGGAMCGQTTYDADLTGSAA
jgi:hypothetical protein